MSRLTTRRTGRTRAANGRRVHVVPDAPRDVIRAAQSRLSAGGDHEWLDEWQDAYDSVTREGDDDGQELLLDVLIAFDHWREAGRDGHDEAPGPRMAPEVPISPSPTRT